MTKDVRPLLGILSPRDIPDFQKTMAHITGIPRLWVKYYLEVPAYNLLRNFFLKSDYTHLAILPDDLLITQQAVNLLISDLEEHDYPVLAGICNLYYYNDYVSCRREASDVYAMTNSELDGLRMKQGGGPIVKVGFDAFALSFIRRDVVEKTKFRGMPRTMVDYDFARQCYTKKVEMYVDTRARLLHLCGRLGDILKFEYFKVGKEKPYLLYEE